MQSQLERLPPETIQNEGGRYTMWLMLPGPDGLVHDDTDFRTPLARITCPTCVKTIADTRTRRRQEAFHQTHDPKEIAIHTRRVANAYTRLAEIEENLKPKPR